MRRTAFLRGSIAALAMAGRSLPAAAQDAAAQIAQIERSTGGRLGVLAVDTGTTKRIAYRAGERFPMCSTFKFLLVSAVLTRVDDGQEQLDHRLWYGKDDVLEYAPVAKLHVRDGMTVRELCEAAIGLSDNTAANVLLKSIGGPRALTAYVRTLGDRYTRLDRTEPSLNSGIPGDVRDTTTPAAMAGDMQNILTGSALSPASRGTLQAWMSQTKTGLNLLRAGFPSSWQAADKTGLGGQRNGTGDNDTRNDIAIAWAPGRSPVIVCAYLTQSKVNAAQRDDALASVGKIAASAFAS